MDSRLTRKERIAAVASAVWIIVATVLALNDAYQSKLDLGLEYFFNASHFFVVFLVIGVLPLVIAWGIYWVKKA